jgi:exodeoxyribonuclease VII small subunit
MKTNLVSYRQAMSELKGIVDRLRDGEDVDVDELVTDVARAKELIDFCGAKVTKAEISLKGIVAELKPDDGIAPRAATNGFTPRNGQVDGDIPF